MYILMENSKTIGKGRRGSDRPIKVSPDPIDLNKIKPKPDKWYSVVQLEEEPEEIIEFDLGDFD